MTSEALQTRYPKLFDRLEDKDVLLRNLIVVDENDKDVFDDELTDDLYDPAIYSHMVYIAAPVVSALEDTLATIPEVIGQREDFKECYDSEGDLWGVVTELDETQIALAILDEAEHILQENV